MTITIKERLDKLISNELKITRNQALLLIKHKKVKINDKLISKGGFIAKIEDVVDIELNEIEPMEKKDINFECEIIYEDDDLIVVNKPYNLTVHKAPSEKNPTLQEWLVFKNKTLSTVYGKERDGIVHRLDKPTSGAIIIAKNNESHLNLSNQLQNKTMGRYYLAIIDKPIKKDAIIDRYIGRLRSNRIKFSVNTSLKKRNATSFFTKIALSNDGEHELIAIKLITGRTHQIRAHLESANRHIIGDELYGYKGDISLNHRIFLHAYILYINHPTIKEDISFVATLKDDMRNFLNTNFNKEEIDEVMDKDNIINSFKLLDDELFRSDAGVFKRED